MDLDKLFRSTKRGLFIILTFSCIGSGFSLLGNLLMGIAYPIYKAMYESGELLDMMARFSSVQDASVLEVSLEQTMAVPRAVYLLHALLYAMSLAGIIMMYRLRKNGCHLYAVSQILVLIVTLLFLGKGPSMVGDVMLTLLFIVYYFTTFRRLGQIEVARKSQEDAQPAEEETPAPEDSQD